MSEQFCTVGGVKLCYETFGDPADPAMLLIMGLGTQMLAWHEEFCEALAERGFHVIRFDNRDIGRSQRMDGPPGTDLWENAPGRGQEPDRRPPPDAAGADGHGRRDLL